MQENINIYAWFPLFLCIKSVYIREGQTDVVYKYNSLDYKRRSMLP